MSTASAVDPCPGAVGRRSSSAEIVEGVVAPSREWSELARAGDNIFLTPEWLLTWWRHFGRDRPAYTILGRGPDGGLEFLVLAYLHRQRPVRILRLVGHGPADELGPICDPAQRPSAMAALRSALIDHRLAALFVGDQLSGAADWQALTGAQTIAYIPSPTVRVGPGGWEELFASRPQRRRTELRRLQRKLSDAGYTVRRVTEEAEVDPALGWLLAAHRARLGSASSLLRTGLEAFHRDFAKIALERGWLRFYLLERQGEIAAAWYGFRFGTADSFYQQGRSPACPSGGGMCLSAHAIRETCDDRLSEHRFLRGGEPYKYEWTNEDHGVVTLGAGVTRPGKALVHAAAGAMLEGPWSLTGRTVGRGARRLILG